MNDLTLLVVSYDGYSDMWKYFFKCKEIFWPDCPYDTVLANNVMEFQYDNIKVVNCGKEAQWSNRTRKALECINTKYVCFLLEDLFFSNKIITKDISDAIDLMEEHSILYYKLLSFSPIKTTCYNNMPYLHTLPENLRYGVSLQAAIWEKEFFLKKIGEGNYNPWYFEAERNKEANENAQSKATLGVYDNRNILNICHMVVQGKYIPKAVNHMGKLGITINTKERDVMTITEYILYRMKCCIILFADTFPFLYRIAKVIGYKSVSIKNSKNNM